MAHEEMEQKTNEIPTAQKLFAELGLSNYIYTLDALHYVRDVSMAEDASRIRINPQNFAKLRSFALNSLQVLII